MDIARHRAYPRSWLRLREWLKPRKVIFSLLTILGSIIVSEFILGALSLTFPMVAALLSRNVSMIVPMAIEDPRLGWRPNPKYPGHDRKGFRNKFVPNQVSIVALGDSQTYGQGVSPDEAWPQQLHILGRTSVYNMAFGGYGPTESLLLLEEAFDLKPKLIIEAFYAGNDLYDSYSHVYERKQLPELLTGDDKVLKSIIDAENRERLTPQVEKLYQACAKGPPYHATPPGPLRKFLSEHSKLYGLLREVKFRYQSSTSKVRGPESSQQEVWRSIKHEQAPREQCQIFESDKLKTVFTANYRLSALNLSDPRIEEGHRISLETIRLMNEQARKAKINFVVLLIPTKEIVFKNVVNEEKINIPKTYESLMENEESMWRKTKNFLRTHAILFIDALPTLRKNVQYGRQPYKWTSDGHPNSIGHRAIAQLVLSEIKKHHLLGRSTGLDNSKATSPERQQYSILSLRASKAH